MKLYHVLLDSVPLCYSGFEMTNKIPVPRPNKGQTKQQPCSKCRSGLDYLRSGRFDNTDINMVYMMEWLGKAGFSVKENDWNEARKQVIAIEKNRLSLSPENARLYGIKHFPAYDVLLISG